MKLVKISGMSRANGCRPACNVQDHGKRWILSRSDSGTWLCMIRCEGDCLVLQELVFFQRAFPSGPLSYGDDIVCFVTSAHIRAYYTKVA